ncbi:exonuclease domain-containing protein [Rhodococcus spongiicola]|uniref:3'-5' exonuclease n=1 Tax=Rhodococcus spongiicola TaxID=2487352 RepID=A0A438B1P5_9NOCA|nr:exonuclease domain-containing protein [Rhodococcus spongiicola]RVW04878.1 3'-5' exonuclease [Rhodococcus spongiicola]
MSNSTRSDWTTRPICAFDLETTGRDPLSARIVTACVVLYGVPADGAPPRARNWIVDPGIEIPADAVAIHGISTSYVRHHGQDYASGYLEIREALTDAWAAGYAVVAFNAAYDLTVMDAEGRRLGLPPLDGYGLVLDPYVIDREVDRDRRGKRTLGALCEHYGINLGFAHQAEADALAAAELARLLPQRFPHLADLEDMMTSQANWHAKRQLDRVEYLQREGRDASDVDGRWPIRTVA